jgi:RNA polymerase sigma factor (sigma-70 family)
VEPWISQLAGGHPGAAWDLFVARYRPLLVATIRRLVQDHDDVMDVFSHVCQALSANDLARLRRYVDPPEHGAAFSTWLVAVVRNLTIDWLRQRDGRVRRSVPAHLSPLQQQIYAAVFVEGRSHVEAYELAVARSGSAMPFPAFLREVRAIYRLVPLPHGEPRRRPLRGLPPDQAATPAPDPVESAESARRIGALLGSLPSDVRLAVELFVVERLSAADVARAVGWPNPKTVYNRVYRALVALREDLVRAGFGPGDL